MAKPRAALSPALRPLRSPQLAAYIEEGVEFPSTIGRSHRAGTTDADRQMVADLTGLADAWPIMTEPFTNG